jgi:hypothetical protein
MKLPSPAAFAALALQVVAQSEPYPGYNLDKPMLGGGVGGVRKTAMLRFGCSQVVIERLDPLVNPGLSPSTHMHQVCISISKQQIGAPKLLLTSCLDRWRKRL